MSVGSNEMPTAPPFSLRLAVAQHAYNNDDNYNNGTRSHVTSIPVNEDDNNAIC